MRGRENKCNVQFEFGATNARTDNVWGQLKNEEKAVIEAHAIGLQL